MSEGAIGSFATAIRANARLFFFLISGGLCERLPGSRRIVETARKAKEVEKRLSRVNMCSKSIDQEAVYGQSNSDALFHRLLPPALYFSSTRTPESAFSSPVTFHLLAYSHTTQHEPRIKSKRAFALVAVL